MTINRDDIRRATSHLYKEAQSVHAQAEHQRDIGNETAALLLTVEGKVYITLMNAVNKLLEG